MKCMLLTHSPPTRPSSSRSSSSRSTKRICFPLFDDEKTQYAAELKNEGEVKLHRRADCDACLPEVKTWTCGRERSGSVVGQSASSNQLAQFLSQTSSQPGGRSVRSVLARNVDSRLYMSALCTCTVRAWAVRCELEVSFGERCEMIGHYDVAPPGTSSVRSIAL